VATKVDQRDKVRSRSDREGALGYKLERLCRYITRPAIDQKRLSLTKQGDLNWSPQHLHSSTREGDVENDKIRIIRIKYGPGEKSVMHTHGPNVAVFLTTNAVRFTLPDGTSVTADSETGAAQWSDKEEHLPENLSDDPLEVVLIELKE